MAQSVTLPIQLNQPARKVGVFLPKARPTKAIAPPAALGTVEPSSAYDSPMRRAKKAPIRNVSTMLGPAASAALPIMANTTPPIAVPTPKSRDWTKFNSLFRLISGLPLNIMLPLGGAWLFGLSLAVSFLSQPESNRCSRIS